MREIETHAPEFFGLPYVESKQIRTIPCCTTCGKEMELVEGDVIYGENWYHANCWKETKGGVKQNV